MCAAHPCHSGRRGLFWQVLSFRVSCEFKVPAIQADPESIPANDVTLEFSETVAHAGVDSGSASDLERFRYAKLEDISSTP